RPGGVVGGPEADELGRAIDRALRERGDAAEPDGALAEAAGWVLGEAAAQRQPTATACAGVARRFGFVGTVAVSVAFDLAHPAPGWREAIASLPRNFPINRYGVHASPGGGSAAVVF